jgi:hypothetical protein
MVVVLLIYYTFIVGFLVELCPVANVCWLGVDSPKKGWIILYRILAEISHIYVENYSLTQQSSRPQTQQ